MCPGHILKILGLQSLSDFQGRVEGSLQRRDAIAQAQAWIDIMEAVGTDLLQVGSPDSPYMTQNVDFADLAQLANMLARLANRGFRVAYKNWYWTTARRGRRMSGPSSRKSIGRISACVLTPLRPQEASGDAQRSQGGFSKAGRGGGREVTAKELSRAYTANFYERTKTGPGQKFYFLQISNAYQFKTTMNSTITPDPGLRPRGC